MKKKVPQPQSNQKAVIAIVAVIVLVAFLAIFANYRSNAGKATLGGESEVQLQDLTLRDGFVTLTVLPQTERTIPIRTAIVAVDDPGTVLDDPRDYTLSLTKISAGVYQYNLFNNDNPAFSAVDILTQPETVSLYLNVQDTAPDLEISFLNNQITVRNLHFLPGLSQIRLFERTGTTLDTTGTVYLPIIRLAVGTTLNARVNASSYVAPVVEARIGGVVQALTGTTPIGTDASARGVAENYTTRDFTWTAPAVDSVSILDIKATVQGEDTHAYYTITTGNIVYAFQQPNLPTMTLQLPSGTSTTATLTAVFDDNTQLQPFSVPCDVTTPLSTLFASKKVQRIYAYGGTPAGTQVWNPSTAPDDFQTFSRFRGYFVQFLDEASEAERTITTTCPVQSLQSVLSAPPQLGASSTATYSFSAGWTLFALPGIVPRTLTDFTASQSFRIFQCEQNAACTEIDRTTLLIPGRVYWINAATPFTLNYQWQ